MSGEYIKGRGAQFNAPNRYESRHSEPDEEALQPDDKFPVPTVRTHYLTEHPKQIISRSASPDVGFSASINPYLGCEHGCIYCYARNSHEYWGFSAGLDFESKIMVKKNAPELLEKQFQARSYQPVPIHLSGNTDCYQPAERQFRLTRRILELCLQYRHPVSIITKNALVLRDIDILGEMARHQLAVVILSLTTLNEQLRQVMEPRTVTAQRRLQVVQQLATAGIPVGVMTAPIIPGLNDQEIPKMVEAAAQQGACWAGYSLVRLNGAVGELFEDWLRKNFPDRAEKVLSQIRESHGGQVSDSRFGTRMVGEGRYAEHISQLHRIACQKYLAGRSMPELSTRQFRRGGQLNLFD